MKKLGIKLLLILNMLFSLPVITSCNLPKYENKPFLILNKYISKQSSNYLKYYFVLDEQGDIQVANRIYYSYEIGDEYLYKVRIN